MAPGSRGVGAVFVHSSGVDSGCRHRRKISLFIYFYFPRYRPPFGECCVCSSISFPFRDTSCVCVGTCVRVCV
jgi:hypothetical protein